MTPRVAAIGECMLELSGGDLGGAGAMQLGYGGDTLNTAIYLARLGIGVDYLTLLGDDRYSGWMLECWQGEGVGTELVGRLPGRVPGLYMIATDAQGERSFSYWRSEAPARELFDDPARVARLGEALSGVDLVYLSGISLSLYGDAGRERLFGMLADLRDAGTRTAFDGNYRPAGWPDLPRAGEAFSRACACADIVLPTFEDEQALFADPSPQDTLDRLHSHGVPEVVLKMGASGCLVSTSGGLIRVPAQAVARPVDTTAAGDSFNAGYLAARLLGEGAEEAARWGHALAGRVIQHRGAILPPELMPDLPGAGGRNGSA